MQGKVLSQLVPATGSDPVRSPDRERRALIEALSIFPLTGRFAISAASAAVKGIFCLYVRCALVDRVEEDVLSAAEATFAIIRPLYYLISNPIPVEAGPARPSLVLGIGSDEALRAGLAVSIDINELSPFHSAWPRLWGWFAVELGPGKCIIVRIGISDPGYGWGWQTQR